MSAKINHCRKVLPDQVFRCETMRYESGCNACSRSAMTSSIFSMPTEKRINESLMPNSDRSSGLMAALGHAGRVLDERIDISQADGQGNQL